MQREHLVNSSRHYIICSIDNPGYYVRNQFNGKCMIVKNISIATKFPSEDTAMLYLNGYKKSGVLIGDYAPIPLRIDYSLIEELDE